MSDTSDRDRVARRVFSALEPSAVAEGPDAEIPFRSTRLAKGVMATMPVVLAGAMTVSMNLTGPIESASAAIKRPAKAKTELSKTLRELPGSAVTATTAERAGTAGITTAATTPAATTTGRITTAASTPSSYTVRAGDSISSIAGRYGLSTASVLAINGLSWKSLIFPGQVLKLTTPIPAADSGRATASTLPTSATAAAASRYTIVKGDTISSIAFRWGVSTVSILAANSLASTSIIYPGQTISIPAASPGSTAQNVSSASATTTPAAPPVTVQTTPVPVASGRYTIRTGDTISSIARSTGSSVAAILAANGLVASSIIYSGRTLVIPSGTLAVTTVAAVTPLPVLTPGSSTSLTNEMAANARTIIQVGRRLGVPDRGIVIALAAAAQESGLRNLSSGDRDSVGVFQQRPSAGWGATAQLLSVDYAARLFYGGASNPNKGKTRGLLDIPGWQTMSVTQAAQAVQISAYPSAYAKWETSAQSWLAQYR